MFEESPERSTFTCEMTTCYIACSCNRVPHCADWGSNGLLCFGTRNAIAIYEPRAQIGRITHTLHRHRDRVNTVQWIKPGNCAPESELLSGSVDGTAIIWSEDRQNNTFRCTSVLDVGSKITFTDSLQLSDNVSSTTFAKLLICTGSVKGDIKLWLREENADVQQVQSIFFERKLPMCCRLTRLPNTKSLLLAITLEDASILLYTKESDTLESRFIKAQRLIGHEDWVICMDFTQDGDGNLFLATGSKDRMIRLWKISKTVKESSNDELKQESSIFAADDRQYNVTLESVLCGHEGWVHGVHWQPTKADNGQTMKLLSCSIDKTMLIWEPHEIMNGMWTETVRVGEVGGNTLGFYGCKFGPDGLHILAHGYQGSFHIWKYSQETNKWLPRSTPSGHFSEVIDLCWEPKGRFLITVSTDQTTRIHAPWKDDDHKELWHEIARPQIHGYDMTCLAMLAPHIYVSGADEKVVRIFTATYMFKNQLRPLANVEDFKSVKAHSAAVPSLELTNKATYYDDTNECEDARNSAIGNVYEPPTEEELIKNTLWPETNKLYGHGYEIFCMATRHDGKLLATACKSTTPEHAAILLWATDTWLQVQKLVYHKLTVTQMEFSPNDKYLLSVSRDRKWSLFQNKDGNYELIANSSSKKDNPHSRIIWCCAWTQDSDYFATGSRDGKIAIWSMSTIENDIGPKIILDMQNQSVTALRFAPNCITQGSYLLAIGYETGRIEIQKVNMSLENASKLLEYDTSEAHHLTVKRLMFRPNDDQSYNTLQLASCSSDHSVKIHDIELSSLLASLLSSSSLEI